MGSRFQPVPTDEAGNRKRDSEPDADTQCGFGSFKPKWLQPCANPKVYLVIFCIIGVIEGAYFTYFVGVLSTLEKRFAFESKVSGIILIADNISAAVLSLLVGYYGGKGHKPRMIAFGMILVCISSFISALPYFMYGPALHLLSKDSSELGQKEQEYCDIDAKEVECGSAEDSTMLPAVSIFFIANFINGFGYTAYYTIGAPYLDDNVKKKNSPMYFSRYLLLYLCLYLKCINRELILHFK